MVALTFAYRKQRHSESAERREDTKLFTERFVKASEQLGHDSPRVRFDGVRSDPGAVSFDRAEHSGGEVDWGPFPPLPRAAPPQPARVPRPRWWARR
ncbi:hypothetical protein AB0C07_12785 [Actinoplanes missouriensis]|uniref:hypothetical protein n=1 Tax=Actinoplanes missouriensis TaxID=1866 RepID=UPI0033CC1A44